MGDVFDEDLMRELGLDPDEMENVRKSLPQSGAKPAVQTASATMPSPQPRSAPPPARAPGVVARPLPPQPVALAKPVPAPPAPPVHPEVRAEPVKAPAMPRPAPAPEDIGAYGEAMTQGIPVHLAAVIAKKSIRLSDVIGMQAGEVIDFKKPPEEPIDLVVNGKLIAKAEMVLVDGRVGVRVVKLVR